MTRITPVALTLLGVVTGTATAQTQATAPIAAAIVADLQLASTGETNFGTVGNFAHTETIDPRAPTSNQTTARFTSTSSGNNVVVYTCPTEVTLSGPAGASLTFTTQLSSHNADQQSSSLPNSCAEAFGLNLSTVFFWLGGSLQVLANQEPGDYNGVFTLTAAYQ